MIALTPEQRAEIERIRADRKAGKISFTEAVCRVVAICDEAQYEAPVSADERRAS